MLILDLMVLKLWSCEQVRGIKLVFVIFISQCGITYILYEIGGCSPKLLFCIEKYNVGANTPIQPNNWTK